MGFKTDTTKSVNYGLVPEGEYEVIIRNAEEKQSFSGSNSKLNFSLVIRNDVEQDCKNRYLFFEIWKKKLPNADDASVDGYNYSHLMNLVRNAGGIPDGTEFETVKQLCEVLIGKCMRVAVSHNTYNGRTSEKIDQLYGLGVTEFPECKHIFKEKQTSQADNFAQKPAESFVSQAGLPEGITSSAPDGFEEILSDSDVPF